MTAYQLETYLNSRKIFYDHTKNLYRIDTLPNNKWKSPEQMLKFLKNQFGLTQALKLMLNITETRTIEVKIKNRKKKVAPPA